MGGNDTLAGGIDADLLDGGEGFDAVDYSGSAEGGWSTSMVPSSSAATRKATL